MKSEAATVEEYLVGLEPQRREALTALIGFVRARVPQARESMRYGMPTFEYGGHVVCAAASQKQYMSLYVDVDLLAEHRDALTGLNLGKSCIRFRSLEAVPMDVVGRILEQTMQRLADS